MNDFIFSIGLHWRKKEMGNQRDVINKLSFELGSRRGIRSVKMTEISKLLKISLKTIYHYYYNKEGTVKSVVAKVLEHEKKIGAAIIAQANDPIHQDLLASMQLKTFIAKVNPICFLELKKFYPKIWDFMEESKREWFTVAAIDCLVRGKEMGLFRNEIDCEILGKMRAMQLDAALISDNLSLGKWDIYALIDLMSKHYLRGIVTPEGEKLLDKYLSEGVDLNSIIVT